MEVCHCSTISHVVLSVDLSGLATGHHARGIKAIHTQAHTHACTGHMACFLVLAEGFVIVICFSVLSWKRWRTFFHDAMALLCAAMHKLKDVEKLAMEHEDPWHLIKNHIVMNS